MLSIGTKVKFERKNKIITGIIEKVTKKQYKIKDGENKYQVNHENIIKDNKLQAISLFSGMGGDSLGIHNCGIDVVAYSEIEPKFQKSHQLNFPTCKLIGNGNIIKTTDDELLIYKNKIDLIFAGFPCQGFSQAGKKLSDDPRNTLFNEFLRATKLIEPDYIIGENVKGLLKRVTSNGEYYIDIIKKEFEDIGYDIEYKILKCSEYGIPQVRERLIIVGIKSSLDKEIKFPIPLETPTDLKDIITFDMEGTIKIDEKIVKDLNIPDECIITNKDNNETEKKPHPNLKSIVTDKNYMYKNVHYPNRLSFGKRIPVGGEIIDIRKPSKTIICTYARQPRLFIIQQNKNNYYLRSLVVNELKQIQGFPIDYKLNGNTNDSIVQIGNAVPPPLIEQVVKTLLQI